ncbi:putative grr1 plant [Tripterygium wilfordii]|uniref:Putative grr1 plant n=1 Tax=Tripterygium wilfordii TaxID=458696 RepID=A0A7J7DTJ1_TRIWF|nr:EIN3-binding F-box protein 1-like [Tripterygium wilfordii]KAF5749613.1 putative grr1 plant [Tripterygium wilfordii]
MPTLVNYNGDNDFHAGGSHCTNSMLFPIGSRMDVNGPPCKRARINATMLSSRSELAQNMLPSIEVLPDECLFEIFRRLPGGKERIFCASVSKKWLTLLSSIRRTELCKIPVPEDTDMVSFEEESDVENDGHLTRSLEGKKATDVRLAAIAVGARGHGGLGKLLIRGSNPIRGVSNVGLSAIARGCPSLKVLSLWNLPSVGDEGLFEIAQECRLLENLDLSHCPSVSDKGLVAIAEKCPNLTALNIESCSQIGDGGIQAVGKFCPRLQSISIKHCPLVTDLGVSNLLSSASPVLMKVKLQALSISDTSLAAIGYYGKAVTNLILCNLPRVSQRGFVFLGIAQGLQKLGSLTITSCQGITDASLEAIGKGCTNLKQMCLRKCCFVSDNGLVAFAKAAGSLEGLQLEECNRVTLLGIVGAMSYLRRKLKSLTLVKCMGVKDMEMGLPVFTPCDSLRSLSIRLCTGFGSASLALIGKLCPQLQHVDLSGLCGITDAGMLSLFESCKDGLVKMNLSGCFNLTDIVASALARLHGGTLDLLNLDGCRKITDAGLMAVMDNCLVLSDLDVSKCSITDSGIAFLSSAEHLSLRVLSLAGCSKVTNKSVPFLRKLGKTLLGLNLQQCNSISSSNVDLLVETLWRCDILF